MQTGERMKRLSKVIVIGLCLAALSACASPSTPSHSLKGIGFASGLVVGVKSLTDLAGRLDCGDVKDTGKRFGANDSITCSFEGSQLQMFRFSSLTSFEHFVAGNNPSGHASNQFARVETQFVIWSDRKSVVARIDDLTG
jgi:hypothetical protein